MLLFKFLAAATSILPLVAAAPASYGKYNHLLQILVWLLIYSLEQNITARDNPWPGWEMLDNNNRTKQIVVDGDNLYQIHDTGHIYQFTGTPMTGWRELDNNPLSYKLVAADGELYQIHSNHAIWKYTGTPYTAWELIDNQRLIVTVVATQGMVFKADTTSRIKQYTGIPLAPWKEIYVDDWGVFSTAAAGGEIYTTTRSGVWRYSGTPGRWYQISTVTVQDLTAYGKDLYATGMGGGVRKWTGVPSKWDTLDTNKNVKAITVGARGLYQIHTNGVIFQFVGDGWKQIDGNAESRSIVAGNLVHQVHNDGKIWRYLN